ncbi:MAG: hypothetical protein IKR64_00910 [Treponema sp.]|nr:hypothetical protein [Treponema sp.]
MYKQPLFGEDSSPHITSMLVSGIVTLVCWIIFCVLCFVIKFKPQTPQYKEVQIVLSSTPVVEKEKTEAAESAPAAAMQEEAAVVEPVETTPVPELPKPVETPVAEAKVEAPKKTAAPAQTSTASAPAAKATDPAKKVNFDDYQYATDYSDFDFNNVSTNGTKVFDDSLFPVDSSEPEPQVSKKVDKVVGTQSGISGSAGEMATGREQPLKSNTPTIDNQGPSDGVQKLLEGIRKSVVAKGSGNGIDTSITSDTANSDSKTLAMADGTTRRIIKSSPIEFSKEAADTIDFDSMTVKITFRVLTDGNVFPGSIKIDKEIFLDTLVVEEIKNQIKTWLLAPANSEAVAIFELTIKKN